MVKTTKRSRKFNAKTGGASSALQKGVSLTKKGKTKRGGGGNKAGGTPADARSKGENEQQLDKAKQERISSDVLNMDNLGALDIDSFFEKAVGGLGNESDDEEEDGANIEATKKKSTDDDDDDDDDDDESSVDSYTSLGSEEMDVAASEAQMKAQIQKLSSQDPEFHKYLKENESSLLEFGNEDGDDDSMGEDDMNDDEEEYVQDEDAMESILNTVLDDDGVIIDPSKGYSTKQFLQQQQEAENKFLLTPQRLTQLEQGAFTSHSIKGLKRIIGGYRTACHLSDANGQDTNKNAGDT